MSHEHAHALSDPGAQPSTDSKLLKWVPIVIWVATLVGGGVLRWVVNKANERAAQELAQRRRPEKLQEAVGLGSPFVTAQPEMVIFGPSYAEAVERKDLTPRIGTGAAGGGRIKKSRANGRFK